MPTQSHIENIGLQLYTVRKEMGENFTGTLQTVASIGYKEIEFAGYFNKEPSDIRKLIDDLGLTAIGAHVDGKSFDNNFETIVETALVLGYHYIIMASLPRGEHENIDDYKRWANRFNVIGERCRASGLIFAYHNHDFELTSIEGSIPYEILLNETDPNFVAMEIDLYWMKKGNQDTLSYFQTYPSRFPLFHVKDMDKEQNSTEIGNGIIDFRPIFSDKRSGVRHYIVEQEHFQRSPLESIRISFKHLNAIKF